MVVGDCLNPKKCSRKCLALFSCVADLILTTVQDRANLGPEGTWGKNTGFLTFGRRSSFYDVYLLFCHFYSFSFFPQKCSVNGGFEAFAHHDGEQEEILPRAEA